MPPTFEPSPAHGLKEAEDALRKSEERLRQAVRISHIGIFDHDHTAGALYMSPTMREIIGLGPDTPVSIEDFASRPDGEPGFLAAVHPDDRERIVQAFKRAHSGPDGIYDVEYRSIRLDGEVRWVAVRAQTFFDRDGNACRPARTVGAVIDITESKRAEEERKRLQGQLLQAQKMESVGRLAGGVAHDFNNMLNVICGYAEMALDQFEPTPPLVDALEEIRRAARRSTDLTRRLLAFARMQAVEPQVLDLNHVVEGSLNMLRRVIGEHITTVWTPAPDLWAVTIDPTQIDQILVNLSLNARDAISDVGRITIATSNAVLDDAFCTRNAGAVPGSYVMLEVTDDGCGIDQETRDRVFEPFFTTKPKGHGTGLGLATVYGIVQQNRGLITVTSQVGHGTSIRILLPRTSHEPAEIDRPADAADGPKTGHERVLLVEDEPMMLHLSQRLLESLGYDVVPAASPSEALRLAEAFGDRFDLLVTDVVMPEMNGRDLSLELRSRCPRLKCMFMSGYVSGSTTLAGMLAEGAHVLQKPFTTDELAAKVRDVLDA